MRNSRRTGFLAGVVEGFYGPPWTEDERLELFGWMKAWGLNTYVYAPKDDLKHRANWRQRYSLQEASNLRDLISEALKRRFQFFYALSPGLDIRYAHPPDLARLKSRFAQMGDLGCRNFCLLFDDIPDRMNAMDLRRWGSLAAAQCGITNDMFRWLRERHPAARLLFCPTAYCGRMAKRRFGGEGYLGTVGRNLLPEIDIFWTGPEIVSREITEPHVREVTAVLRRPPLIWDNLHANDYDGRRFYCGPYSGRSRQLLGQVSGLLSNPNTEFPLNFVPLRTFGEFINGTAKWDSRRAYKRAIWQWCKSFRTVGGSLKAGDLEFFCDCYYLPYEEGPTADKLVRLANRFLTSNSAQVSSEGRELSRAVRRLGKICARMADLYDRRLFHALHRRLWELREEMALLEKYVQTKASPQGGMGSVTSDFHLPLTYRGGMVARLQSLLAQHPDGSFSPCGISLEACQTRSPIRFL